LKGDRGIRFIDRVEDTLIADILLGDQGDPVPWGRIVLKIQSVAGE
jgi:hypothetical protein